MKKSERTREKHHATLRSIEIELKNTLDGLGGLLDHTTRAVTSRDCKTARLNFDQVQIALKTIAPKLTKAAALYHKLKIPPGPKTGPADIPAPPAPPPVPRAAKKAKPKTEKPAPKAKAKGKGKR